MARRKRDAINKAETCCVLILCKLPSYYVFAKLFVCTVCQKKRPTFYFSNNFVKKSSRQMCVEELGRRREEKEMRGLSRTG